MEPVRAVAPARNTARLALAALAVLALVPAAGAKGPLSGNVCAIAGCTTLANPGTIYQALRWEGTFEIAATPRPAPFYTLTFWSPDPQGFRWRLVYAPSRRLLRVDDRAATPPEFGAPVRPYWRTLGRRDLRLLAGVTRGREPFPAPARWRP